MVEFERLDELLVRLSLLALNDRAIGALDNVVRLVAVELRLRPLELDLTVGSHEKLVRV